MPAVSITSFRLRGSITWTRTSTSNSPAPRRRRAGKPTNAQKKQGSAAPRPLGPAGRFCWLEARNNTLVLLRRGNVDMRHHDDLVGPAFSSGCPCDLHARVHPIVDCADEIWFDLLAKFPAVSGGQMRVVGLLVLPDRHDRELIGWGRALQDVEARISLVLAAGIRELPQQVHGRPACCRRNLDVAHHVNSAILRVRGVHGSDRHQRHGEQKRKSNAHSHPPQSFGWLCDSTDLVKRPSTQERSQGAIVMSSLRPVSVASGAGSYSAGRCARLIQAVRKPKVAAPMTS